MHSEARVTVILAKTEHIGKRIDHPQSKDLSRKVPQTPHSSSPTSPPSTSVYSTVGAMPLKLKVTVWSDAPQVKPLKPPQLLFLIAGRSTKLLLLVGTHLRHINFLSGTRHLRAVRVECIAWVTGPKLKVVGFATAFADSRLTVRSAVVFSTVACNASEVLTTIQCLGYLIHYIRVRTSNHHSWGVAG